MLQSLLIIDSQLTQFINSLLPHNHFFDLFFSFFSMRGDAIPIWIAIILFLIIFEGKKHHRFVISFIVTVALTLILVNGVIKNIVQRPRPFFTNILHSSYSILYSVCPKDFSFPSGHASTAFAAATVITFYDKKRKWFYYSIAGLISLSRIYLGCHYFLDVVSGGLIGYLITVFSIQLLPKKK